MNNQSGGQLVSCLECQRRKQKCNRQFPCNHCAKRGVAHLCRFVSKPAVSRASKSDSSAEQSKSSKKRSIDSPEEDGPGQEAVVEEALGEDAESDIDASDALNALGYMPHAHHLVLGKGPGPKKEKDAVGAEQGSAQCEELKAAMLTMPPKPYVDCLVDNWLSGANHHYYALYPPEFRTQYDGWWTTPPHKVSPELTSLILRVCACSALFILDDSVRVRLESELRADATTFANRMHTAAEKLAGSIAPGKGGLVNVQQLFLTAFWYKSAEKWTEAWHALGVAIRAGNEIGLHQDSLSEGMSEFDREMRRRLWGILYMWDFALGSMLSRPSLVNHADCTFVSPTLALESDPGYPDMPSPFRHINLHCKLCLGLAAELKSVSNKVIRTEVALRLKDVMEQWLKDLPPEYALKDPDTRWDEEYDWVVFQRRYLHLVGYRCLFDPLKPYVTRNSAKPMSDVEKNLRAAGVQAALGLMDVSWIFFENMVSAGAKFHYAVFCIFDTTTVLCSAFVHDEARNLPQRETVLEAIKKGLNMLEELNNASKTTAKLCRILKNLVVNLPLSAKEKGLVCAPKRIKASSSSPASDRSKGITPPSNGLGGTPFILGTDRTGSTSSAASESDAAAVTSSPEILGSKHQSPAPENGRPSYIDVPPPNGVPSLPSNGVPTVPSNGVPTLPSNGVPYMAVTSAPDLGTIGQPHWQYPPDVAVNMNMYQDGTDFSRFDGAMPTVLEYCWDWQGLDLGNPQLWVNKNPPM